MTDDQDITIDSTEDYSACGKKLTIGGWIFYCDLPAGHEERRTNDRDLGGSPHLRHHVEIVWSGGSVAQK